MCREMLPDITAYLADRRLPLANADEQIVVVQVLRFVLGSVYNPMIRDVANPRAAFLTGRELEIVEALLDYLRPRIKSGYGSYAQHSIRQRYGVMRRVLSILRSRQFAAA